MTDLCRAISDLRHMLKASVMRICVVEKQLRVVSQRCTELEDRAVAVTELESDKQRKQRVVACTAPVKASSHDARAVLPQYADPRSIPPPLSRKPMPQVHI